jgi:1-acyl-sn-glycerol-3-phosphate acyltransferase
VVANHFHFLDSVILILSAPWFMEFLADFEMPNVPFPLKIFPKLYQTYDVAQGTPNLEALWASEAILAQDGVLGIFPEGRVQAPPLRQALPGAAFLVLRTGAPLLPVGIYSEDDWKVCRTLIEEKRRLRATCQVGEVFGPLTCANPRRPSRETIGRAGDRIMFEIAQLLPESMWGDFPENAES